MSSIEAEGRIRYVKNGPDDYIDLLTGPDGGLIFNRIFNRKEFRYLNRKTRLS
jgi:hypothetical protein